MRIVILTTNSFFSYLILKGLINNYRHSVVSIVLLPSKYNNRSFFQTVLEVYRKAGIRNFLYRAITSVNSYILSCFHKVGLVRSPIFVKTFAIENNIPILESGNCNRKALIEHIRKLDTDYLLSVNVYQKICSELIDTPGKGAWNIHFGDLPKYRGMSPYIWALSNNEDSIGITIHELARAFDTGRIIMKEKVVIKEDDSAISLYIRGCEKVSKMLVEAIEKNELGQLEPVNQTGQASYFSYPNRVCIYRIHQNGHRLWRIRDLFYPLYDNDI